MPKLNIQAIANGYVGACLKHSQALSSSTAFCQSHLTFNAEL
jgi:hypothetical protein